MMSLLGFFIVCACVITGYTMHHGNLAILWQPTELIIICGSAFGALVISSPMSVIKGIVTQILNVVKGHIPAKADYMELLNCLYELIKLASGNAIALEPHIEGPEKSEIFKKYPFILHNHHALLFICDTLRVQILGTISPYDLDDLMENDITLMHEEEHKIPATITTIGDAMPGLGIVAAVLGIVITMGKLSEGKEAIGLSVAAALVGTFLGILLSYGFIQPLAGRITGNLAEEGKIFSVIKAALVAYSKGCNAKIAVEFARRAVPIEHRPSFEEVDKAQAAAKG